MAYRRSRKHPVYDGRDLQLSRYSDSVLRVLACVHSQRNVPPLLSLLELLNPTKKSPISVCALHLIQLTSHVTGPDSDHITATLHSYEQHAAGISFELVTAISPFSTMHEDVCSAAEDRRAALIVLPFHRAHAVDGGMEALHPSIRAVNAHALKHAPCSVAVLVDRGLCGLDGRHVQPSLRVAVLFFGGADDREALACAWRMAGHPSVALTAVRFFTEGEQLGSANEACISEYRIRFVNEERVEYVERVVGNSEEAVAAIRGMGWERQDLYVVGRGGGCGSRLTYGMEEWADCPELGPIGDLLASLDYEAGGASVLVVQQYAADDIRDSNCRRSASSTGAI